MSTSKRHVYPASLWQASLLSSLLAATALGAPSQAVAQAASSNARAAATELFDAAQKLKAEKRYAEACPKYQESYRLDPQLGALLHLADCLEKNGELASAYASFREAAEIAAQRGDKRVTDAKEHAAQLEPRLSRLTVEVPSAARVAGLKVTRDGLVLSEGSFGVAIPVDGGEHKIEATAPGYEPWRATVTVASERASERVEVGKLEPSPSTVGSPVTGTPAAASEPVPAPPEEATAGGAQRTLGFVIGGAGVVGLGVGSLFLVQRNGKAEESNGICPSDTGCAPGSQGRVDALNEEARSAQTLALVGFIGGGVALATGAVLILTAPKVEPPHAALLNVAPLLGPGVGGVTAQGRF